MTALYIGIMSGTSLDGIDTVLVDFSTPQCQLIAHHQTHMPADIKRHILSINQGQTTDLPFIGELDHRLGHLFARSVLQLLNKAQVSAEQICAIGSHGQTVYHQPDGCTPFTMQLGDANIIAVETGIDTVADFRRKDMALGGQGAPLVPAFHRAIFPAQTSTQVILNIGGIANITVLPADGSIVGYDTGPGNMLMDAWCEYHIGKPYDEHGEWAKQGQTITPLLSRLMRDPYLDKTPPKSTGREHYHLEWLTHQIGQTDYQPEDVQRTLCEFTAASIAHHIHQHQQGPEPQVWVCGGGVHNPLLMKRLDVLLPEWQVKATDSRGYSSDYMEAMAFAWLAKQRLSHQTSNVPEVTGARQPASLGVIYYA